MSDSCLVGSQTEGLLENGVYVRIPLDNDLINLICDMSLITEDDNSLAIALSLLNNISNVNFCKMSMSGNTPFIPCYFDNFMAVEQGTSYLVLKLWEEDDNLSELYGGMSQGFITGGLGFEFLFSIPYYIPSPTQSTNTTTALS